MSDQLPIFCPACDQAGHESLVVKLRHTRSNDGAMMVKCPMGHTYDYARLMQMNPRMLPMQVKETQPARTIQHAFWVYPEALAALQQRYPQNFMTTMCAAITALADPDTILIEGEHARALRDSNVTRGREIMTIVTENAALKQKLADAENRLKLFEPMFKSMGMTMPPLGESADQLQAVVEPAKRDEGFKFHIPRR